MTESVGWGPDSDNRQFSPRASGDEGPWARWIPNAWAAVADPSGRHDPPALPVRMGGPEHGRVVDEHAELLAWWGPFLHLTMFGLGWNRPDLGIQRWIAAGAPADDPILALVRKWWLPYADDFLGWGRTSPVYGEMVMTVASAAGSKTSVQIAQATSGGGSEARWFGPGTDEMHVANHLTPIQPGVSDGAVDMSSEPTVVISEDAGSGTVPRATLLLGQYADWYGHLTRVVLPKAPAAGTSWRVDVVCKPLGWLGEYRLSRVSNRWFRGQHRWHQLGL